MIFTIVALFTKAFSFENTNIIHNNEYIYIGRTKVATGMVMGGWNLENPAGFWNRVGARFLDGFILAGFFGVITGEFVVRESFTVIDVLSIFYALLLPPIWYGYTLGRRALGNRIVKTDGSDVTFINIVLRELVGGLLYFVTFGIALVVSAFMVGLREDKRGVHDFIGGTYVTKDAPNDRDRSEYDELNA